MSTQVDNLYQQVQTLSLRERLELLSLVLADLQDDLELQEELAGWERLSDEAPEPIREEFMNFSQGEIYGVAFPVRGSREQQGHHPH